MVYVENTCTSHYEGSIPFEDKLFQGMLTSLEKLQFEESEQGEIII